MDDYSVLDSILDAAFVVEGDGKIIYCNDAAATFCQSSVRRLVNKAVISDLFTLDEPNIFPFTEESQGRQGPTPFIETTFHLAKDGKSGKVQLAVRPVGENHWAFTLRDVSLEEALHSKYRSELSQKEEYAKNLEKLVEARTAELRAVNQTLNAILNSLGQGFFTFNSDGDCGDVFTKACAEIIEGLPKGRKAWEVLGVPSHEIEQFKKWTDSLYKEPLPFDDLKVLGPNLFPHSQNHHVVLDYFPIRDDQQKVRELVVVATDKTTEYRAQLALEAEKHYAAMIIKYIKNKDQFTQFLGSVKTSMQQLQAMTKKKMDRATVLESFRLLHTLEGEAGTFSIQSLRELSRVPQQLLEPFKEKDSMDEDSQKTYAQSLVELEGGLSKFLSENQDVIKIPQGTVSRSVELPVESIHKFLGKIKNNPELVRSAQDLFLKEPIENRLKYFDGLMQTVAERLGKKVKPLSIVGGDLRIFPEPYAKIFSSLVHAFRNAVDHGLEAPEEREWVGKDPAGTIKIEVNRSPKGMNLTIQDDGKGIDPEVIRKKLKEKFPDRDFSKESDEQVIQNVCLPGFSSRDGVGEFSGRGVGLDALREELLRVGGSIHLKSKVGEGTTIELFIPDLDVEIDLPVPRSA